MTRELWHQNTLLTLSYLLPLSRRQKVGAPLFFINVTTNLHLVYDDLYVVRTYAFE